MTAASVSESAHAGFVRRATDMRDTRACAHAAAAAVLCYVYPRSWVVADGWFTSCHPRPEALVAGAALQEMRMVVSSCDPRCAALGKHCAVVLLGSDESQKKKMPCIEMGAILFLK